MFLIDKMKNKIKSGILEKLDNEVDSHDIQIEVKPDDNADYDNMRFIKHRTFTMHDDKMDNPPVNGIYFSFS
jgi:hypothetical protein